MVNADPIGNRTLRYRNNCPAHDRHDHDSGTVSRERTKFSHSQGEDAREHDRIENTDPRMMLYIASSAPVLIIEIATSAAAAHGAYAKAAPSAYCTFCKMCGYR